MGKYHLAIARADVDPDFRSGLLRVALRLGRTKRLVSLLQAELVLVRIEDLARCEFVLPACGGACRGRRSRGRIFSQQDTYGYDAACLRQTLRERQSLRE